MGSTFLIIVVLKWIVTTRRCRLAMTRQIAIPCPQPSNREPEFRAEKLPKMMAVMAVALTHSVWAQVPSPGAESGALQEIIVTAQRREESIQQAPMSVTVLTGQMLQDFGVRDFQDYAKAVANLSFGMGGSPTGGPAYGYSSTREIIIRGVSGPNTTSLYIDDTPIPNVIDPRVLDLQRIEVLRGPQGTLFGASSMGGTVRLITQPADTVDTSGKVTAQAFDINAGGAGADVSGTLNIPLRADVAALRLNGFDFFNPGYFDRVFGVSTVPGVAFQPGQQMNGSVKIGATHEYGGSASMLVKPVDGLTVTPMIIWQRSDTNGYPVADNVAGDFTQVRPLNVPEGTGDQWQFYALTAKYAASFGQLVSSTSYLHRYAADTEDGTTWFAEFQGYYYPPANLPYIASQVPQSYNSKETTEELRFESQFPGPVQLVTGVFYQRSTFAYLYNYLTPGADALSGGYFGGDDSYGNTQSIVLSQIAGFADLTYKVSQSVELSIGARKARLDYSTNEAIIEYPVLDANSQFSYSEREQPVTPRYVARYNFDKDNTVYVSASKGFRIGGVSDPIFLGCSQDAANLGLPVGVPIPYHSDSLWSYEVGLKNLWNDQRLATRFAVYDIDWKNIQQNLVLPTCGQGEELNAGAARIHGAEGEFEALVTSKFRLEGGVGYEEGKITEAEILKTGAVIGFPVGSPLSNVPKWTASLRGEYVSPTSFGDYFVRPEYNFVGSSLSLANGGAGLYRAEYSLVDLRTGLRTSEWRFTLFAKNLFNRAANFGDIVTAVGAIPGQSRLAVEQPRTLGLEVERVFGPFK